MAVDLAPVEAILLAAGQSRRMGQPKLVLPWGDSTVLGSILTNLQAGGRESGLTGIVIITGGDRRQIEDEVEKSPPALPTRTIFNPDFAHGEMLSSIQTGIKALAPETVAALIVLGDQPQLQVQSVQLVLERYQQTQASIIVPSYENHRGHPWLAAKDTFPEILALQSGQTLRDFFNKHSTQIEYVMVESNSVLQDLDTPEDYYRFQGKSIN